MCAYVICWCVSQFLLLSDRIVHASSFCQDGTTEDFDFKGGAGAASGEVITGNKPAKQIRETGKEIREPLTPEFESDADSLDSDRMDENGTQTTSETPVRKSARTAGKSYK